LALREDKKRTQDNLLSGAQQNAVEADRLEREEKAAEARSTGMQVRLWLDGVIAEMKATAEWWGLKHATR